MKNMGLSVTPMKCEDDGYFWCLGLLLAFVYDVYSDCRYLHAEIMQFCHVDN